MSVPCALDQRSAALLTQGGTVAVQHDQVFDVLDQVLLRCRDFSRVLNATRWRHEYLRYRLLQACAAGQAGQD